MFHILGYNPSAQQSHPNSIRPGLVKVSLVEESVFELRLVMLFMVQTIDVVYTLAGKLLLFLIQRFFQLGKSHKHVQYSCTKIKQTIL